ncbi:FAD-dependent oxidoreductase [Sciscionella marina]|uniref:FAD-dependent oxidoreductase n=1 Tax=Sciscionella marina TaxID=508770 RepID=UPI000363971B|nr:FAD-dependent oxidoreductase [Sciscionella marina]
MRITVVGAGVIGLTAALRLSEQGHTVRVLADKFGEETTSAAAAALWLPYLAEPYERVLGWGIRGLAVLRELAGVPGAGVRMRTGVERCGDEEPSWLRHVGEHQRVPGGVRVRVPVVDMSIHLPWLAGMLHGRGVSLERGRVARLDEIAGSDLVVNCTGRAAEELVAGERITPMRGQIVVLEQCGIEEWIVDDIDGEQPMYVIPREHTVICGGTLFESADTEPDPVVTQRILRRCAEEVPAVGTARVLTDRVGLRPTRAEVRLEFGVDGVLHCYGHGGSGVTMAYGCAEEVASLVAGR